MNRIEEVRIRAGMSREELAEAVGTTRTQVWRWESGEVMPLTSALVKLADVLGCTTDYLLGRDDERTLK